MQWFSNFGGYENQLERAHESAGLRHLGLCSFITFSGDSGTHQSLRVTLLGIILVFLHPVLVWAGPCSCVPFPQPGTFFLLLSNSNHYDPQ